MNFWPQESVRASAMEVAENSPPVLCLFKVRAQHHRLASVLVRIPPMLHSIIQREVSLRLDLDIDHQSG